MQLRACLGPVLLGLGACTSIPGQLPGHILIDVDGSTIELRKKPVPEAAPPPPVPQPPTIPEAPGDEPAR